MREDKTSPCDREEFVKGGSRVDGPKIVFVTDVLISWTLVEKVYGGPVLVTAGASSSFRGEGRSMTAGVVTCE